MQQRISGDRELISTSVACEITGFSRGYIQRLVRQERIEGVKLGHDWLVYEDSLKAFLAQPRIKGRPKGSTKYNLTEKKSHAEKIDTSSSDSGNSV